MGKMISEKLLYCATRLVMVVAGAAPLAFWALLFHGRPHEIGYTLGPAAIALVLGLWLRAGRASPDELRWGAQLRFFLSGAAVWLAGPATLFFAMGHFGSDLGSVAGLAAFILSVCALGVSAFLQPRRNGALLTFLWFSSLSAMALAGLPTC